MSSIALCKNKKCPKKDTCLRFQIKDTEDKILAFQNICTKDNNYQWYIKTKTEIIKEKK